RRQRTRGEPSAGWLPAWIAHTRTTSNSTDEMEHTMMRALAARHPASQCAARALRRACGKACGQHARAGVVVGAERASPSRRVPRLVCRFRELVEARDVPFLGFDNGRVFAVGVDPAVNRPLLAGGVFLEDGGPMRPAGDPAQQILLGERRADGVVLEQTVAFEDE